MPEMDLRRRGFWPEAQRTANTVFFFFMNPILDDITHRISGTKLMAWIVVWADTFDIIHNHSLQELRLKNTTTPIDAIDLHNVEMFALAFAIWFGVKGMAWAVDLVNAWKGHHGDDPP